MVSIKDVAARCGVSVATVSKAMNGHADIGEATRIRVMQVAEEMGYMPNSAARALKTNRTYNIGVLFVDEANSGLTHEYFAAVLDSCKKQAESAGYDITFINRNIGKKRATYLEHCRYRGVDGVIAACIDFSDPEVIELARSNLPLVTVDHVFNNRSAVLSDNAEGVQKIVHHLAALGHERIAFIYGRSNHTSVTEKRVAGFYKACEEEGIPVPDEFVVAAEYHGVELSEACTKKLLALKRRATAILYPDDYSTIGGLRAIREAGLSIPEDISVVGYDGINLSRMMSPTFTTYRQDTDALGRTAANLLINLLENPRTALPEQKLISGSLQIGGTTAAAKR